MAVQTLLDECLSIRGGRLFIEECDADELARRFGTPFTVMSEDQLRRNARRYRREFEARWPAGPVVVLASIKANFALATPGSSARRDSGATRSAPVSSTRRSKAASRRIGSRSM